MSEAARSVRSLELVDPDGTTLPSWTPGAHIDLELPNGVVRQYSLCGSPADRGRYQIAVLLEARSRGGSEYLHRFVAPGSRMRFWGPSNHFALEDAPGYAFIAGGVGITPVLTMVEAVAGRDAPWSLLYGGRSRDSMAFVERLEALGEAARILPEDVHGLLPLEEILDQHPPDHLVYCCGPEPLIEAVERILASSRGGSEHLRVERFRSRPRTWSANTSFAIECRRSSRTVAVSDHETALEALQAAGLPIFGACLEGTCGTCEVVVLEGEAEHRDELHDSDPAVASDRMFVCVSRSRTATLVIDL